MDRADTRRSCVDLLDLVAHRGEAQELPRRTRRVFPTDQSGLPVREQIDDRLREIRGGRPGHRAGVAVSDLASKAAGVGDHDGCTDRHRLRHRQSEGFVDGREHVDGGASHPVQHFGVRPRTDVLDDPYESELLDERPYVRRAPFVRSDEEERGAPEPRRTNSAISTNASGRFRSASRAANRTSRSDRTARASLSSAGMGTPLPSTTSRGRTARATASTSVRSGGVSTRTRSARRSTGRVSTESYARAERRRDGVIMPWQCRISGLRRAMAMTAAGMVTRSRHRWTWTMSACLISRARWSSSRPLPSPLTRRQVSPAALWSDRNGSRPPASVGILRIRSRHRRAQWRVVGREARRRG